MIEKKNKCLCVFVLWIYSLLVNDTWRYYTEYELFALFKAFSPYLLCTFIRREDTMM